MEQEAGGRAQLEAMSAEELEQLWNRAKETATNTSEEER
jgi:uncharacterized protein YabN with tetrapyrrole methylase and pyrophosphatase domain